MGLSTGGLTSLMLPLLQPNTWGAVGANDPSTWIIGTAVRESEDFPAGVTPLGNTIRAFRTMPNDLAGLINSNTVRQQFFAEIGARISPNPESPLFADFPMDRQGEWMPEVREIWRQFDLGDPDAVSTQQEALQGLSTVSIILPERPPWVTPWNREIVDTLQAAGINAHGIEWSGAHADFQSERFIELLANVTAGLSRNSPDTLLMAGDADQDLDFDQLDLVKVQVAAKYLTGQTATWGEGDWNGAPGGSPGNPPVGDKLFNQFDIVAAQQGVAYLTGPYAAIQANGTSGDGQTSVVYNAGNGELSVDASAGVELTSINIDSATGIFTGASAENLGGSFDNDSDANIFKATFGGSFGSVRFGNVAQAGLSEEFVIGDLSVVGSLAGGGDLGNVDLVYVPEPMSVLLLSVGLAIALVCLRGVNG